MPIWAGSLRTPCGLQRGKQMLQRKVIYPVGFVRPPLVTCGSAASPVKAPVTRMSVSSTIAVIRDSLKAADKER